MADISIEGLKLIEGYLTSIPAWYLATVEDGRPHVRPFSFARLQDGQLQFCTATTKDVFQEMQANPWVELTAWKPGHGWIIMRGKANLNDNADEVTRQEGYLHMTGLGETYDGPQDEHLTFFTIDEAEAWLCEIDGSWNPIA